MLRWFILCTERQYMSGFRLFSWLHASANPVTSFSSSGRRAIRHQERSAYGQSVGAAEYGSGLFSLRW